MWQDIKGAVRGRWNCLSLRLWCHFFKFLSFDWWIVFGKIIGTVRSVFDSGAIFDNTNWGFSENETEILFSILPHPTQPLKEGLNFWKRQNLLNNKSLFAFALLNKEYFWWIFWLKDFYLFLFAGQGVLKYFEDILKSLRGKRGAFLY